MLAVSCGDEDLDAHDETIAIAVRAEDVVNTSCRRCCVVTDRALSVSPSLRERAVNRRRVRQR